jgi:hypothetical protein
MSMEEFAIGALVNYKSRYKNVALLLACSLADATSSKCYPNISQNGKKNKKFINDNIDVISRFSGIGFFTDCTIKMALTGLKNVVRDKDGYVGLDQIVYHTIRCSLVHKCEIDKEITLSEEEGLQFYNGRLTVPTDIIAGILFSAILCEKNLDERTKASDSVRVPISGKDYTLSDLWGQKSSIIQELYEFHIRKR